MRKWIKRLSLAIAGLFVVGLFVLGLVISHTPDCEPREAAAVAGESYTAVQYRCYGSPDVLEFVEVEKPVPSASEVLVRVEAAAVNPLDWHYMRGSPYLMRLATGIGHPDDPRIGVDFAGVVEAVGPDVTRFSPGDRVFGRGDGAFAEYLVAREDRAITTIPDSVAFEQAAAMPVAAITALQALRDKGQLQAGQKVLINGASGGVGTFAVQIAKTMGAEVHGVCSERNVDMVTSLGADRVFDYRKENYTESGESYDLIVDMVGNHSIGQNRRVLKPDGRLVMVGGAKGDWIAPLKRPIGAMLRSPFVEQELITILARLRSEDLAELASMAARGDISPVIDYVFPLAETADAIRYSETGRARGKIIIDIGAIPSP